MASKSFLKRFNASIILKEMVVEEGLEPPDTRIMIPLFTGTRGSTETVCPPSFKYNHVRSANAKMIQ
jgi:hypothetical protein